jgi:hypothetical protein
MLNRTGANVLGASNSPPNSPPFNSRERMSYIRRTFFSTDRSFGARKKIKQIVQSAPLCQGFTSMEGCVENRRWTLGRVTYITLNIPGVRVVGATKC